MAEPCFNAKVLAATLLWNSETFAKEMIKYSNDLNTTKILWWEKLAKQAEKLINEKISIAMDVRILRGEAWDQARIRLAKDLSNKWYTLKQAVEFFNKLENISLKDIDDYGGLLFREGEKYENVSQAMSALREAVATHIITESHLKNQYWVQDDILTVWEWWVITWTEKGQELINKNMRKIQWRAEEIERISKWQTMESHNMNAAQKKALIKKRETEANKMKDRVDELTKLVGEIVPISNRWTEAISEIRRWADDVEAIVNNYIIWSVFIWQQSEKEVTDVIEKLRLKWKNTLPKLTVKDIKNIKDINSLFERVYANALDIANNTEVRAALKERLYMLMNDWNNQLIAPAMVYADSLMSTLLYCDAWDSFNDVLKYHRVWSIIQDYLAAEKWTYTRKHAKTMFNELKDILNSEEFIKNIWTTDNPKKIDFLWLEFTWEDFLRLVYSIAWDENLKMVYKYWRNIPDDKIFDYVRLKLFWNDVKKAEDNIKHLISNFVKPYKYQDLTAMWFKTTSSIPIAQEDFPRTTFVSFDKRIKAENANLWSAYWARAEFNDALANVNTLTVSSVWMPNNRIIDLSDWPTPAFPLDTKYIVIPNGKYSSDEWFKAQIQQLKESRQDRIKALKKEIARKNKLWEDIKALQESINWYWEDIIIVYPKWKESWQYFIDPWTNKIKYKTTNTAYFNELSRNIAANTFNRATTNLSENTEQIAKQMAETTASKEEDLNKKAMKFWRHFLWVEWEKLTNEQVINKLSQLTGIPFTDWAMWAKEWSLAQDVAFHRYSTSANYYTDIVAPSVIDEDIKLARASTPEGVARELEELWYRPNADAVRNNIEAIREAKVGMVTSPTLSDYLWFKWTYIWLATNPQFKTMDLSQYRQVFNSEDPVWEIARLLYWEKRYTKNELLQAESYLWDFTDAIVDEFATNLMKSWYQLPLSSPKLTVLNYIRWKSYYWDKFVQDFIFKNWLTDDEWVIARIFDDYMPSKTTLWSDVTADEIKRIAESKRTWNIVVKQVDEKEKMLPSWHNSYWAAVWWRPVSMKTIDNLEKLSRSIPRESEADIRKKLSQYFTKDELDSLWVVFVDNMVNKEWKRVWWWFWVDGWKRFFRFSTDAAQWTADHETVHAFINMFFTDEQRNDLIDYIIKNHWEDITEFAEKHWYTDLEIDRRAEEWLAEWFVKYAANMELKRWIRWLSWFPKKVIDFFERLYKKIKKFIWLEDKITSFYNDVYKRNRKWYSLVNRKWWHSWWDLKSDSLLYRTSEDMDIKWLKKEINRILKDDSVESYIKNVADDWRISVWDVDLKNIKEWDEFSVYGKLLAIADYNIYRWKVLERNRDLVADSIALKRAIAWWKKWWYTEVPWAKWMRVRDLINEYETEWYSPMNFVFNTDWNWVIEDCYIWIWNPSTKVSKHIAKTKWKNWTTVYFLHSDWWFLTKEEVQSAIDNGKSRVWLILPWWISMEFSLKKKNLWLMKLQSIRESFWNMWVWESVVKWVEMAKLNWDSPKNWIMWEFKEASDKWWDKDTILEIWNKIEERLHEQQKQILETPSWSMSYRTAQGIWTEENTTKLRKALGDYIDEKDKKTWWKWVSEWEARQYITSLYNKWWITLWEKDAFDDFLDSVYNKWWRLTSQDLKSFKPHSITFEDLYDFREYWVNSVPWTRRNRESWFTHLWDANLKDNYWKWISMHWWSNKDNPIFHARWYIDNKDDAYKLIEVQSDFYQWKEWALWKVWWDDFKIVKDSWDREFLRATKKNWQRRALLEELSLALDWYNAWEWPSKFWLATPMTMAYNEWFMEWDVLNKEILWYEISEIFRDKLMRAWYKEEDARDIVSSLRYWNRLPEFLEDWLPYKPSFGDYYTKNSEWPFIYFHYWDNYGFNTDTIAKIMKEDPLLFERVFWWSDTEKLWKDVYKNIKKEAEEYGWSDDWFYNDLLSEEKWLDTYKEKVAKVFELIDTGKYREWILPHFYSLKKLDLEKTYRDKFDIRSTRRTEDRDRIALFWDNLAFIDWNYGMATIENIDDIKSTDELLQELDSKIYDIWKSLPEEWTKYSSMWEYWWVNGLNGSHRTVVNSYIKDTLPAFYRLIDDIGYWRNNINTVKASDDWMEYFEIDLRNVDNSNINNTTYYRNVDPTLWFAPEWWRNFQLNQPSQPRDITEADVIQQILKNYEDAVEYNIKNKTLTVKKSQDLKQQASYALNTAIEDLIFPKYWEALTSEQKQLLLWLWYNLKLATSTKDLALLKEADKQIMEQFNKWWSDLAKKVSMSFSNIEEMDKALMRRWKVYVERGWNMIVVDVHDELIDSIKSIPDWAWQFTNLRTMTEDQIRTLSNRHAYTLLKLIDIVKMNIDRWNFYTALMMQLNPQLRNVRNWLNFFQAFKAVKVWDNAYVPSILQRNITAWYLWKWTWLSDSVDEAYKSWILKKIYDWYASQGKTLTKENLDAIISEELSNTGNEWYAPLYANAFAPYTNIVWLPRDTYAYLNNVFKAETESTRKLLQSVLWKEWNVDELWWNVLNMDVTLNDGSTVKVWDLVSWSADAESWKQRLFWEMNKTEEWIMNAEYAEEFWVLPEERLKESIKWAHAWYNWVKFVSQNEADTITSLIGNARKILQKDTNTNQFVEFDYIIWWQNDILRALIEDSVFSWLKITDKDKWLTKRVKQMASWALKLVWLNTSLNLFDASSWAKIQQMYEIYYSMTLDNLKRMQAPEDKISLTAFEMAKYFKTAETMLGSKNWAKWVAMNSSTIDWHSINRAFWNLWTIVRNIERADWVYSLMNKIWNNQIIWMFRFAKEWDAAYHPILKRWWSNTTKARYLIWPWAAWYHEYTRASKEDMAKEFNQIFWTNLNVNQATMVLQALGWVKFISDKWYSTVLNDLLWNITNTAVLTRAVMSYPLQLFTVYPQLFAYNVKANWIKRWLWVENVNEARAIRKEYWILEWTYVEFWVPEAVSKGMDKLSDYAKNIYNEYFLKSDNPEIEKLWLEFDDWVLWLYWKVTDYSRKIKNPEQLSQLIDSTRDNANNIIDAAMAQTFKWLAFVKALQNNDFITFMNPKMFKEFMDDPNVAQEVKDKLLRRVDLYANRSFQDMLWIWFTWLDRIYTAWWVSDLMWALLSVINFKWAWWTNMFRQTFEKIWTMRKIAKINWANIDETVKQIMAMPEYTTLIETMFADAVWMWRMWKFTDTGKWEDESDVDMMDFILWAKDNLELVSQQWQGILSFWLSRLLAWWYEWFRSWTYWEWGMGDWVLWFWVWFFNAFAQNLWRNWKPRALVSKALLLSVQNWSPAEWWNYLANEWYKLSWGTMRYLIEEGETSYWANTPITIERWAVPSFIMWMNNSKSDTAFTYKMNNVKQIEYLKQVFDWSNDNETRWWAAKELFTNFLNSSQYLKTINYLLLEPATAINYITNDWFLTWSKINSYNYNIRWIEEELMANSPTFKEFYETGRIVPPDNEAIDSLFEHYMKPNFVWWYKAYQWIQNFLEYWHINWKKDSKWEDNWSFYDRPLEELYQRIEEDNPWALKQFMDTFNSIFLWDAESDEARKFTWSWFVTALNNYKNDPEYKKYVAAYDKWLLNYDYYNTLALVALDESNKRKSLWLSDWLEKVSSSDIKKLKWVIGPINEAYYNKYADHMYKADMWLMQNEMYNWVADELWEWLAKKYFSKEEETDWNWAKTWNETWVLSPNISSQIRWDFEFKNYVDRWLYNDALTYSSMVTKRVASEDKSWLIRAAMIDNYVNYIENSDWSPEMKTSAIAHLMDNNDDVFQYNSEFAEKYPEIYEEAKWYLNDLLHNINMKEIQNLNNVALLKDALIDAFKDSNSSSKKKISIWWWGWWWGGYSSWLNVVGNLAKRMAALQPKDWKTHTAYTNAKFKILPVAVKWVYPVTNSTSPSTKVNFRAAFVSNWYDPTTKTLWPITPPKKNKAVKGKSTRKMTQKEENELDLL